MIFRGKILWIWPKESIQKNDGSTMIKISFVVEEQTDREYKDTILLDMFNDRAEMFANTYKEGDVVSVTFGGRVRDYTNREGVTKKICSLSALRVDLEASSQSSQPAAAATPAAAESDDDDLPF
jgi:single-stranded DNA-binding protein